MEDKMIELITKHLGLSFFIGIVVVCLLIFIVWWLRGVYDKLRIVDNLPCQANSAKIDNHISGHTALDVSIARIETAISYMQKSIDSFSQSVQKNNKIIIDPFTQSHSPIAVTEIGLEMMKRINGFGMFNANWERIKKLVEDNASPKNPYDIQQYCIEQAVVFPEKFLQESELNIVKLDAYSTGIPLTSYMRVFAILTRDRYFKEHGIHVSEVDSYSPNE